MQWYSYVLLPIVILSAILVASIFIQQIVTLILLPFALWEKRKKQKQTQEQIREYGRHINIEIPEPELSDISKKWITEIKEQNDSRNK